MPIVSDYGQEGLQFVWVRSLAVSLSIVSLLLGVDNDGHCPFYVKYISVIAYILCGPYANSTADLTMDSTASRPFWIHE